MSCEREMSVWSMAMRAKGVRCYSSSSSAFHLLTSDVVQRFSMLPAHRFWRETVSLLDVM